jgi:ABC-type nitrate/sulfonate/bicarbonate transport system substrate-binding protein
MLFSSPALKESVHKLSALKGGSMMTICQIRKRTGLLLLSIFLGWGEVGAQEKIKIAYSALDSNAVWYVAKEKGFYLKQGLDADLVFIPTTTTTVASIVAGDIKVGNATGGGVASAGGP